MYQFLKSTKSASDVPPQWSIPPIEGTREGEAVGMIVSFQDRGHGMTTERRAMTFFYAQSEGEDSFA